MTAWDALGPVYAKLGIATAPEVISARKEAAEAGYDVFKEAHLASAVRGVLGLGVDSGVSPLFEAMREKDPTLDLEPTDIEATALLSAILSAEMASSSKLGGLVALALVTAAFGATRQSATHPTLVRSAEEKLANMQLAGSSPPRSYAAPPMPDEVTAALDAIAPINTNYGPALSAAPATEAIRKIADYALGAYAAAATQANQAQSYTKRLEEELRTYWWVVGGWSDEAKKPFRELDQHKATILAGYELAAKTSLPLGLFAAPALLDRVIREERKGRPAKVPLAESVVAAPSGFGARFGAFIATNGDLLPLSFAIQLAGESGPDEDWKPRFKRIAKLSADMKIGPSDIALQMYREALLSRALPQSKS